MLTVSFAATPLFRTAVGSHLELISFVFVRANGDLIRSWLCSLNGFLVSWPAVVLNQRSRWARLQLGLILSSSRRWQRRPNCPTYWLTVSEAELHVEKCRTRTDVIREAFGTFRSYREPQWAWEPVCSLPRLHKRDISEGQVSEPRSWNLTRAPSEAPD